MRVNKDELYPIFISTLFLIRADLIIRFSESKRILKRLQNLTASRKVPFYLTALQGLKRTRLISLVEAVDRRLGWKPSCLRRTLALGNLFCQLGSAPKFMVGVTRQDNALRAHSWLEMDGTQLEIDDEAAAYSVLSPSPNSPV